MKLKACLSGEVNHRFGRGAINKRSAVYLNLILRKLVARDCQTVVDESARRP